MRQLRFVRPADDGTHVVVETADGNEQFALALDPNLREVARGEAPRPSPSLAASRPAGELTIGPREIQVRVRAGESPEHLAESLGVSLDRILRFAGPVVDERLRITGEARRARARRSTTEGQTVVFGEAVDERFGAHGIMPADVRWDSRRRDDGEWVVVAEWLGGDGTHTAEWLFHRTSRSITPSDDTAADLLSDRPIRPIMPVPPSPVHLSAAPPLAPGVVAFPPMPDAHTGPLPAYEEVFDQEAAADGPREVPPLVPSASEDPGLQFDAPPLPLGIVDPSTRPEAATPARRLTGLTNLGVTKREESEVDRAARTRVPSWDDILLGVRRKQD